MRLMEKDHAERMLDHLTANETVAIPALESGRLVYALETPDDWGEVVSIVEFNAWFVMDPSRGQDD